MRRSAGYKYGLIFIIAAAFSGSLMYLTRIHSPNPALMPQAAFFLLLVVTTTLLSMPLGGGTASLLAMAVVASYLALGLVHAAWIALLGELHSETLEAFVQDEELMHRPKGRLEQLTCLAANATQLPDSGPGTPAAAHHALFQKYRQVEAKAARRRSGGPGLDYCRLVVEVHGSKIWVESAPHQGACFHILLPAVYSS